jgi:hypothetical protein
MCAWICVDLDNTLVEKGPGEVDPETMEEGEPQDIPTEGAVEAMQQLAEEGHRLTVFTARFNPMPAALRNEMKQAIEQELQEMGFPPMEVWTGMNKPSADIFIDDNAVTYDGDWGLALAQAQQMLEDRGLAPGPQPGSAEQETMNEEEPAPEEEEVPQV